MRRHYAPPHNWSGAGMILIILALGACSNPLEVETPRRTRLDSLVVSEEFIGAPGDSLFARVADQNIVFAAEVSRPFHNAIFGDETYITVQATRYGLQGRDYEILSLRLDAIRDTGVYRMNGPYSAPKSIDRNAPPRYGALYERRIGSFPEAFRTSGEAGEIRVRRIDRQRGVVTGTFSFRGYCVETETAIEIRDGAFRLQLNPD